MNVLRNAIVLIVAVCVSISTATAQVAHVVDQAALDMVVSDRIAQDEADRATVLRLLSDSQVQTAPGASAWTWSPHGTPSRLLMVPSSKPWQPRPFRSNRRWLEGNRRSPSLRQP